MKNRKEEQLTTSILGAVERRPEVADNNFFTRESSISGFGMGGYQQHHVEDELRRFKFWSVLILLVSVGLATVLAVYQHTIV